MAKEATKITKILAKHLKRLSNDRFAAFIDAVCKVKAPRKYKQIQIKQLKRKTPMKVADIIMRSYTVRYGPAKVKKALGDISENQIRLNLQKDIRTVWKTIKQSPVKGKTTSGAARSKGAKKTKSGKGESAKGQRKKTTTDPKMPKKSPVRAQTSGGAGKRAREEPSGKGKGAKRARKDPTSAGTSAASCQDLILSILRELGKESFKLFNAYLRDEEFLGSHGFSPIPRVQLEDKDCVDVADRLINHYTEDDALKVMKIVLEKINEKKLAQRLRDKVFGSAKVRKQTRLGSQVCKNKSLPGKDYTGVRSRRAEHEPPHSRRHHFSVENGQAIHPIHRGATSKAPIQETALAATSGDKRHFVDRHRAALIGRVTLVAPILDDLKQYKLLTHEDYCTVRSKTTSQDQMRKLFCFVNSWGNEDKNKFLQSLRRHNAPLIRDLEKKQPEGNCLDVWLGLGSVA